MAIITISHDLIYKFKNFKKSDTYINEAQFGLNYLYKDLKELADGANVLEVGSGPGILLTELSRRFPKINIHGIEPNSDGFQFFSNFQMELDKNIKVHWGGYETFKSSQKWDLIFLVNVFEHLQDWTDFLLFLKKNLSRKGKCIILCPNYSFPYESHFGIPVLFSKKITHFIFKKYIYEFEQKNDCKNLWQSLNFVKYEQVRKFINKDGKMNLYFNVDIVKDLIQRLSYDPNFASRQKFLAFPAKFLLSSGILNWLLKFNWLKRFLPYMHLEIRLK